MRHLNSRREFLSTMAHASAAVTLSAVAYSRVLGANGRLRVASVGCGGKGWSDLTATAACPKVDVVALCDIDESKAHLGQAAVKYPQANRYTDWRKLFEQPKSFDAVIDFIYNNYTLLFFEAVHGSISSSSLARLSTSTLAEVDFLDFSIKSCLRLSNTASLLSILFLYCFIRVFS